MVRLAPGRASGVKPKAESSGESQIGFPYRIGRGPGQRAPAGLLAYRVLVEIGYSGTEDTENRVKWKTAIRCGNAWNREKP